MKFIIMGLLVLNSQIVLASTDCQELKTGTFYKQPGNIAKYFTIKFDDDLDLQKDPTSKFSVFDQDGKPSAEVQKTLDIKLVRMTPFYEETSPLPQGRGATERIYQTKKVYVLTALVTSSKYDLDWVFVGDSYAPTRSVKKDIFCAMVTTSTTP